MTPIRTAIVHLTALLACGAAGAQTPPGAATDSTASTASATAAGPVLRPGTNAHFIPFASPPGDQSLPMANAPRLAFDITFASVTVTDDLDRKLVFITDGKKRHFQLGAAVFDAKATWDGGQLTLDMEGPDGLKITQRLFLSEDGSKLFLIIRIGDVGRDGRPVGVNRVYNRVN